jgi:hypothetical protein
MIRTALQTLNLKEDPQTKTLTRPKTYFQTMCIVCRGQLCLSCAHPWAKAWRTESTSPVVVCVDDGLNEPRKEVTSFIWPTLSGHITCGTSCGVWESGLPWFEPDRGSLHPHLHQSRSCRHGSPQRSHFLFSALVPDTGIVVATTPATLIGPENGRPIASLRGV